MAAPNLKIIGEGFAYKPLAKPHAATETSPALTKEAESRGQPPVADVATASKTNTQPQPAHDSKRAHSSISDDDEDLVFEWDCNQVRRKINTFLEAGEMKVKEFQDAIGVGSGSYARFMAQHGRWDGMGNNTMAGAYKFFKKREAQGIAMPKKRKSTDAAIFDVSDVHLEGEEEDAVQIYDSCDEVRRKISAHLRKPGVTQASFLKTLAAQFRSIEVKLQSKQLNDFRGKHGADAGNTSRVFYAAYVFFEKLRIKEKKPKGKHRVEMERVWGKSGGFDTTHVGGGRGWVACMKGETPLMDQYGKITFSGVPRKG
ncbi:hypothetical protein BZA05DRAFT_471014 [Tricharina praecox]|uniref:uncharacterized protein n=1 Tax=Tricharina praecox TaxID=43433 RepID=UPI00221E3986|nr:uncharacterized protein BZA05DRAFT_471014 [Tricharina praecox]KAI5856850.1 hypothetical protein BZA05DRAFT_471014 [Tricharina praecox]